MEKTLPIFPHMPNRQLQYLDNNGKWKDCSWDWRCFEGENAHEYRELPLTNDQMRKYAHDIVDYFADVAEIGEVCGSIENKALCIYVENNRITFSIGERK